MPTTTSSLYIQSTLVVALMLLGLFWNKKRKRHVGLMSLAILWDILLIIQIEWSRQVVEKALKFTENNLLLKTHISLAVLTVFLYISMVYTGLKLLKGHQSVRPLHRKLGLTTLTLRLLVYSTSLLMIDLQGKL